MFADKTILFLIFHQQLKGTAYISTSEVSNYTTSGTKTILEQDSFERNGNNFLCKKSGTIYILGSLNCEGGTPSLTVYKNGNAQSNKGNYRKLDFEFSVDIGDIIQFSCTNNENYWWNTGVVMIL